MKSWIPSSLDRIDPYALSVRLFLTSEHKKTLGSVCQIVDQLLNPSAAEICRICPPQSVFAVLPHAHTPSSASVKIF